MASSNSTAACSRCSNAGGFISLSFIVVSLSHPAFGGIGVNVIYYSYNPAPAGSWKQGDKTGKVKQRRPMVSDRASEAIKLRSRPVMKKLTILIIDDDENIQKVLEAAAQEIGHTTRTAKTIKEGRAAIEEYGADLVLLDRDLPDGDGINLCLALKKDPRFKAVPILMLTGMSETGDKVLGLRFGADDYLAKPFDMEELLARIDALARRLPPDQTGPDQS
ncbi:MAG TPA: hypothetical protein DCS63_01715 [Elusimicrobia bacterium]|nr:hypothetical protein [Elusimicrobiota bacterium]